MKKLILFTILSLAACSNTITAPVQKKKVSDITVNAPLWQPFNTTH